MEMDKIVGTLSDFGIDFIKALVVLIVGIKLANWVGHKLFATKWAKQRMDPGVRTFLQSFISVALKVVVVISAAMILGVPGTSLITMLASAGVAIGLAMQGSLSNLAGGLMILIFKPFKVGDYIGSESEEGTVRNIGVFYTTLRTLDNRRVMLPNGTLTNNVVINYTAEGTRRVDLEYTVAYETDLAKALTLLKKVGAADPRVLREPELTSGILSYDDSAVRLTLWVFVRPGDYWQACFDLNERVKKAFDENGITIPFPQMDVHLSGNE